jgi:hypothetical protein
MESPVMPISQPPQAAVVLAPIIESPEKPKPKPHREVNFTNKTLEYTVLNIVYNNPVLPLVNIPTRRPDSPSLEALNFHGISVLNRERIIDWIL